MYLHNQYHVYMQYTWYMYIYKCISHRVAKKIWSSCWDTTSNLSKLASCLPFSPIKRKGMWAWQLLGGGSVEGFQTISGWIVCLLGSVFQLIFWVSLGNTPRMFTYHVSSSFVGCNGQVFGLLAVFFPERRAGTRSKHHRIPNEAWRSSQWQVTVYWWYEVTQTTEKNQNFNFQLEFVPGLCSLLPNVILTEETSMQCCLLPKHHAVTACRMLSAPWPQDIRLIVCWVVWEDNFFLNKRNLCARVWKLAGWMEISLFIGKCR